MKKLPLILAIAVLLVYGSCGKSGSNKDPDFKCTTCKTTPDAVAANDASYKGIYVGVLIGSTGTIKFDVNNSGSTLTAVITIDGVSTTVTATVISRNGQSGAYVSAFSGTLNGQPVTINFSVGEGGQSPSVLSATVPGHPNISFTLAKETSTALIEAFEGTYSTTKPENGTFNIILSRKLALWGAVARKNGSSEVSHGHGVINNNTLFDEDNSNIGTISGDGINGEFTDSNGIKITLTGKRTL